jgi:hypothetical protein
MSKKPVIVLVNRRALILKSMLVVADDLHPNDLAITPHEGNRCRSCLKGPGV